jgi:hypothetical protein
MRQLRNEEDVAEMLAAEAAVLFIFVDWSEYARRGAEVFNTAEMQFHGESQGPILSWWMGDFSSIDSPFARAVHHWLRKQDEKQALHLFPNVATGNGSIIWMIRGEIVNFAASAVRLGIESVLQESADLAGREKG